MLRHRLVLKLVVMLVLVLCWVVLLVQSLWWGSGVMRKRRSVAAERNRPWRRAKAQWSRHHGVVSRGTDWSWHHATAAAASTGVVCWCCWRHAASNTNTDDANSTKTTSATATRA